MKTNIKLAGFLLLSGISLAAKAQPTPYTFTNNLHCSVDTTTNSWTIN